MKRRFLAALTAASIALAVFAAPTAAGRPTRPYYFYDCTGGSLSDFWAVKTATPPASGAQVAAASAFDLVDSNLVYTVFDWGLYAPHGIDVSPTVPSVWCWVDFAGIGPTLVGGALSDGA